MDALRITGIRAYGYTGLLPEEQTLGQWYEANLTLWMDLSKAGESDRIEDAHDYRTTVNTIREIISTSRFKLIEKLAEAIAQSILLTGEIEQVQVQLTKLTPPIPNFDGSVSVEIIRKANRSR